MRTVRYSEKWESCKAALAGAAPRLDEIEQGVEWAVSLQAETYGEAVPGTSWRVALTDPFPGAPAMVWYFSIEDADYAVMEWFAVDWEWVDRQEDDDETESSGS
jgi:hypothetical protein